VNHQAVRHTPWRSPGHEKTVLIADDDRTVRMVLARILRADGYRILEAERAEKCLFLSLEKQVDAFLVGIDLPGLDGVELCRRIRAIDRYRFTPIICITRADEDQAVRRAFDAGADDFVSKPVNPNTLRARLSGRIQKMERLREADRAHVNLGRYLSRRTQTMIDAFGQNGVIPAPQVQHVCVLVSDIRSFTQVSHELDPNTLFNVLSTHLGMQVECVYRHGGYVDRFGGDGITAVFDGEARVCQACACALEIAEITGSKAGPDPARYLQLGIGIHCGEVAIGNIGTDRRLDYSVIGETVNLAGRLCGFAEPLSVVVTEEVRNAAVACDGLRFTAPCRVAVRGSGTPVTIYNVQRKRD
jgi:adenylate cyclase